MMTGPPSRTSAIAIALRQRQTALEARLWGKLRNRQFHQYKFRRQHPMGRWVVDFVCLKQKLIVELDGGMHALRASLDAERDKELQEKGFLVLRLHNHELKNSLEWCLNKIRMALEREIP